MKDLRSTGPIVVGVDGSEPSRAALRWAAQIATRKHLTVQLVHAAWVGPPPYPVFGDLMQMMVDATIDQGNQILARAHEEIAAQFPDLEVTTVLLDGPAVANLIGQSGRASMIVIGATGTSLIEGLLVGSVALDLPPRSYCPVIVVRGDEIISGSARPVVVGIAGSALDRPTIEFAFEQASFRGAPLIAVHAVSDTLLPPMDRLAGLRTWWTEVEEMEHRQLSAQLAGWTSRFPDVDVTSMIVYDRPADALLDLTAQAELAVVGTRGRGMLAGVLLGSVSRTLLQHSSCPVAVVRSEP